MLTKPIWALLSLPSDFRVGFPDAVAISDGTVECVEIAPSHTRYGA